ncbi:outer membrane protein [Ancylobacter pratisalsi]|uniref:Uncharacterized protein n=1 Tax=Ancylobacter pratisalsi TaxID=1745854 RepID=A0A6P1YRF2_9HYPH|nr:hypothetical protein [Ancylobacter pratisalsi]QIB35605.1 hypothetical protein G3A50_19265 [Ancylobacter pratisalsi]
MKTVKWLCAAGLVAAGMLPYSGAQAADPAATPAPAESLVPASAFFVGGGGSFNSTRFTDQTLYAQGVSTIYLGGVEIGDGYAGGPMTPNFDSSNDFSGMLQFGYFRHFTGTDWLWGAKVTYNYIGAESEIEPVIVPQVGAFTGPSPGTFEGNVVARSYSTRVNNQFALVPFLGRSFDKGFFYFGAGPTLSRVEYAFNDVVGFADLSGVHYDITGWSDSYSSTSWVWGGEVVIGATYFLTPDWFVDASYTYSTTEKTSKGYSGPFATETRTGYTDTGVLSGSFTGRSNTQTFMVSINRAF